MTSLTIPRFFTTPDVHPFETVEWETRHACIVGESGTPVFEQKDVEFPASWSGQATNIVASKYFRVLNGEKEDSVRLMIDRVTRMIAHWGVLDNYFDRDTDDKTHFYHELTYILLHQYASFNSPVWFNVGIQEKPQTSACFLLDVEDNMESILEWFRQEGTIFKGGSGSGINLSKIRAKGSALSGGGKASGVMSFARVADTNAGAIASGGTTRRAAKLLVLDVDHPEIEEFIWCKVKAEAMARALIGSGYQDGLEEEVRQTIPFQNANNSVNVTDEFMRLAVYAQQEGGSLKLFHEMAQAAHACGDPGLFFGATVNGWHTTPSRGLIVSGNPCMEVMQPPDTACNLASINLLKYLKPDGSFDVPAFKHTVDILITAQDILVDRSSYPTEKIAQNSRNFRPLGLGYANLGALLMAKGLPYDSDDGRSYAQGVTSLMTAQAYAQSARLADVKGAFTGFVANKDAMLDVVYEHYKAAVAAEGHSSDNQCGESLLLWEKASTTGRDYGFRNAQVTLLAPTGTISFMMDCSTTGIEPDIALVKHKKIVGGGTLKMVNKTVARALETLGYNQMLQESLCAFLYDGGCLEGCLSLHPEHLPVFDCAFPSYPGGRALSWEAHVKMVAAVQPFLSGGVSKTINMPNDASVEDIERAFVMAWQSGLKSIAVYRDGCKTVQPVTIQPSDIKRVNINTDFLECAECSALPGTPTLCDACKHNRATIWHYKEIVRTLSRGLEQVPYIVAHDQVSLPDLESIKPGRITGTITIPLTPTRKRLPDERPAVNHKFSIGGHEGYIGVGLYPDTNTPGELFVHMAKEGSTVSGLMDTVGILTSLLLQYGVPLKVLVDKLKNTHFEPSGFTTSKEIHRASSPVDYIFRWLESKYILSVEGELPYTVALWHGEAGATQNGVDTSTQPRDTTGADFLVRNYNNGAVAYEIMTALDAPTCAECGQLMAQRAGSCFVCASCGTSSGCS